MHIKDTWEFSPPLDARLWSAWLRFSGDPEKNLVSWIRVGAVLGMEAPIEESGIFPLTDLEKDEVEASEEISSQMDLANYKSFVEAPDQAEIELQRLGDKGFCIRLSSQEVRDNFTTGTISRLALILKVKDTGDLKRRIIIDLLRSGGTLVNSDTAWLPAPAKMSTYSSEQCFSDTTQHPSSWAGCLHA